LLFIVYNVSYASLKKRPQRIKQKEFIFHPLSVSPLDAQVARYVSPRALKQEETWHESAINFCFFLSSPHAMHPLYKLIRFLYSPFVLAEVVLLPSCQRTFYARF
jgi:hypothetical protein